MGMDVVLSVEAVDDVILRCREGFKVLRELKEEAAAEVMAESPEYVLACSRPWLGVLGVLGVLDDALPAVTDTEYFGSR